MSGYTPIHRRPSIGWADLSLDSPPPLSNIARASETRLSSKDLTAVRGFLHAMRVLEDPSFDWRPSSRSFTDRGTTLQQWFSRHLDSLASAIRPCWERERERADFEPTRSGNSQRVSLSTLCVTDRLLRSIAALLRRTDVPDLDPQGIAAMLRAIGHIGHVDHNGHDARADLADSVIDHAYAVYQQEKYLTCPEIARSIKGLRGGLKAEWTACLIDILTKHASARRSQRMYLRPHDIAEIAYGLAPPPSPSALSPSSRALLQECTEHLLAAHASGERFPLREVDQAREDVLRLGGEDTVSKLVSALEALARSAAAEHS